MSTHFQHYDALRVFVIAAQYESLSEAAEVLHLTKGAVSQQIKRLEAYLGFGVFDRHSRGIRLSEKGRELLAVAGPAFTDIESRLIQLRGSPQQTLTIGVTSYFASRWLSPRLTGFMRQHPQIHLRIQPMIDQLNFDGEEVDLSIRWGHGRWTDCLITKLFNCPAWPSGNREAYEQVSSEGIKAAFASFTLLRDRDDSNAWSEWFKVAGLKNPIRMDTLIITDPNVRVQAVLDGQGIALNDDLASEEISSGKLMRLSEFELKDYGYFFAYKNKNLTDNPAVELFMEWILNSHS